MFDIQPKDSDTREQFVKDVDKFISDLLGEAGAFRIVPTLVSPLRKAWDSHENKKRIKDLASDVSSLPDSAINAHGLRGSELNAKMEVVKYLHSRFLQRGGSALLRRLIDVIDNLLESLLDAAGVGSAIKELKDAVKGAIDED